MIESKELRGYPFKEKSSIMKKLSITKGFRLRGQSQITMLWKLRFNTSPKRQRKLLSSMKLLREPGTEFNIYLLKHRSFIILKGKNILLGKAEGISKPAMLKEAKSEEEAMFREDLVLERPLHTRLEELILATLTQVIQHIIANIMQEILIILEPMVHQPTLREDTVKAIVVVGTQQEATLLGKTLQGLMFQVVAGSIMPHINQDIDYIYLRSIDIFFRLDLGCWR